MPLSMLHVGPRSRLIGRVTLHLLVLRLVSNRVHGTLLSAPKYWKVSGREW